MLLNLKRSTLVYVNFTKPFLKRGRKSFLNSIALPNLNSKSFDICESEITEKDVITALKSMATSKFPGHDYFLETV